MQSDGDMKLFALLKFGVNCFLHSPTIFDGIGNFIHEIWWEFTPIANLMDITFRKIVCIQKS